MKTIDVFQANQNGIFLFSLPANELPLAPGTFNVPYGAYTDAPPAVPEGMLARRIGDGWVLQQDNRQKTFYIVESGDQYSFDATVMIDGAEVRYDGGGDVPAWLTDVKPVREEEELPAE